MELYCIVTIVYFAHISYISTCYVAAAALPRNHLDHKTFSVCWRKESKFCRRIISSMKRRPRRRRLPRRLWSKKCKE